MLFTSIKGDSKPKTNGNELVLSSEHRKMAVTYTYFFFASLSPGICLFFGGGGGGDSCLDCLTTTGSFIDIVSAGVFCEICDIPTLPTA